MYTNCTYVLGSVNIHPMEMKNLNSESKNLDFLKDIIEVSGYVRIQGPVPTTDSKLPFSSLKIVRGETLTQYSDHTTKEYSLFVYNVNRVTNLGFNALRGKAQATIFCLLI